MCLIRYAVKVNFCLKTLSSYIYNVCEDRKKHDIEHIFISIMAYIIYV